MSDILDADLEDEIPASKIVNLSNENCTDEDSCSENQRYVEVLGSDNEIEENYVEYYVDYTDEEDSGNPECKENVESTVAPEEGELYHCSTCNVNFSSVENHIDEFHKNQEVLFDIDNRDGETDLADIVIKKEEVDSDTNAELVSLDDEAGSADDTLEYMTVEKMNKQQSGKKIKDDFLSREFYEDYDVKNAEAIEEDEVEYAYLEQRNEDLKYELISEEKHFDINGRPYLKKKIRFFDVGYLNSVSNTCESCKRTFTSEDDMSKHVCMKEEEGFTCLECGVTFHRQRSLASHSRVHKASKKPVAAAVKKPPSEARCEICNTVFPSIKSLKLHRRMHDPIKMKTIADTINSSNNLISSDVDPKPLFTCLICNNSYDMQFKDIHLKAHNTGLKLICPICNKKFVNQINLTMHMNAHQDPNKTKPANVQKVEKPDSKMRYQCAFCERKFSRPHEKVKHERIHTGEKPYKCDLCGKCFRVSYCLTLHLRTHTGARPYVCPHCNKRFKAYSVYNHHLMTHSDQRPYKCPYCPKAFKTSVQLGGHKNSHTKPFSCPDCNRPFASLYAVKAHMETHKKGSQNLKHRCKVCGAVYARIFALRDHLKEQHLNDSDCNMETAKISLEPTVSDIVEEISVSEMDHFQAEEIVTDWLKEDTLNKI